MVLFGFIVQSGGDTVRAATAGPWGFVTGESLPPFIKHHP